MLTPQEVSERSFVKAMRGYNMAAVDEFLDELTDDYTALYKENAALKAKLKVLVDKVEEYRATEDSMRTALLTAQKMASSMVSEAEEKKETLIADAELEARAKIGALHDEIIAEQKHLNEVKAATEEFVRRTRAVCEQQLRALESLPDLTQEAVEPTTQEAKEAKVRADDVSAIGEKILAAFDRKEEPAEDATVVLPQLGRREEPEEAEPEEEPLEPDDNPFVDTATRPIKLSELKFGKNYHAED